MPVRIIGEHPLQLGESGRMKSHIGTVFPRRQTLVTLPGIHAWQRMAFIDHLNHHRQREGLPALTPEEEYAECEQSVDLILEPGLILIRPDPDNMQLAFEADELLQEFVSKRLIKFLQVRNEKVHHAIRDRGEYWRVSPLPRSPEEMSQMIRSSRMPLGGLAIYYYNKITGVRYLTYQEFAQLEPLEPAQLAQHLQEIAEWSSKKNRQDNPEIDFFGVQPAFGPEVFAGYDWFHLEAAALRAAYQEIKARFHKAVPLELQRDQLEETEWRNRMFSTLISAKNEALTEEVMRGLSPEFFLQVEWLPGGRMEHGELLFDSIFEEAEPSPPLVTPPMMFDQKVKGFIFNLIREFGDLGYINVGRVVSSLSRRPPATGRRDVYIAELKQHDADQRIVRILRMQKWGIREHLEEGKDLLRSIIETEEYTEYILDRRLGCRQLGMNLPKRIAMGRVSEKYSGFRTDYYGQMFWATYFERDYIFGIATDKISAAKFSVWEYALRFARLLGRAAVPNMIVGRLINPGKKVVFDDGDETVMEDAQGLPQEIMVTDHTAAFVDYETDLLCFARDYAQPINRRLAYVAHPAQFAGAYLSALLERFLETQAEYRWRRRAFDTLFKHRPRDEAGSFAYRWEKVLQRLDRTPAPEMVELIKKQINFS